MDLQADMDQQLKRFEAIMSEVYMEHEKLMERMNRDFELEKDELEHNKKELSAKIESMLAQHKIDRQKVENDKWEEIEGIKERNKEELADKIDKGMLEKASLTLIGNDFRERNNQKKGLMKDIENKEDELKVTITSASAKRAQLKS